MGRQQWHMRYVACDVASHGSPIARFMRSQFSIVGMVVIQFTLSNPPPAHQKVRKCQGCHEAAKPSSSPPEDAEVSGLATS